MSNIHIHWKDVSGQEVNLRLHPRPMESNEVPGIFIQLKLTW